MALGPVKLGKTFIKRQAAWGTKETSFSADDLIAVEGVFVPALTEEALGADVLRSRFGAAPKQAGSRAGGTAQFSFVFTAPTSLATPTNEHHLVEDALGVLQAIAGIGTIANTSTTLRLDVTTANVDWIGQGALAGLTGGGRQIVWVRDVDTTTTPDEVDITETLATPDDAVSVTRTITIGLTEGDTRLPFTMQFATTTTNGGFRAWDGRVASMTIEANAKAQVRCTVQMTFLNAEPVDALAVGTYAMPRIQLGPNINAISMDHDTDSEFCYSSLSIAITQTLVQAECNGSAQGASQLVTADRTVVITERVTTTDIYTDAWQAPGALAGRAWGMTSRGAADRFHMAAYGGYLQLQQTSQPVDLGGIWGVERVWEVRAAAGVDGTAGNSTVKNTLFRISFG